MSSMAEKLGMVKEAESRAEQVLDYYRKMAEETISEAHAEAEKLKLEEETKAREEGENEMREIIAHGRIEGEELRVEYMYDRMRLLAVVVERRKDAVAFLVDKLEKGD
jgi:vacuolar-type H+-ATPase subunit H